MSIRVRRYNRSDASPKVEGAGNTPFRLTVPPSTFWQASDASTRVGNPLAFTQSRDAEPRVLRELHVSLQTATYDQVASTGPSAAEAIWKPDATVVSRVLVIVGDAQALTGVTVFYANSLIAGRVNGRIAFDTYVGAGLSEFRWSAESGPLVEGDQTVTVLLSAPLVLGQVREPTLAAPWPLPLAVGSVAASYETLGGAGAGVGVVRGVDRG